MEEEEEEEGVGGKRKTIFTGLRVISAIRALCEEGGFTDITKIDAIMLCSLTRSVFSKIVNWSITIIDIK